MRECNSNSTVGALLLFSENNNCAREKYVSLLRVENFRALGIKNMAYLSKNLTKTTLSNAQISIVCIL